LVDFTKQKGKRGVSQRLRERYLSIGIPRRRERERERRAEKAFVLFCAESRNSGGERDLRKKETEEA
jgi:hypothetical protein